jgi:hypothetical protein
VRVCGHVETPTLVSALPFTFCSVFHAKYDRDVSWVCFMLNCCWYDCVHDDVGAVE